MRDLWLSGYAAGPTLWLETPPKLSLLTQQAEVMGQIHTFRAVVCVCV